VLAAGDTPGVRWEYELLARERLLDKTLLLFPPTHDATGNTSQRALSAFQEATSATVDTKLGVGQQIIALIPAGEGHYTLLVSSTAGAADYVTAIRSFFQQRTSQDLSDPLSVMA
jgi:hypothetical protein